MAHQDDPLSATHWSRIQAKDFDYFAERYWRPIYRFVSDRLRSRESAEDITQEMFLSFVRRDILTRATEANVPFRAFLFRSARNFLIDLYRSNSAMKRGGGEATLSLDTDTWEPTAPTLDAERAFDREWFLTLLNRARHAVKEHYESRRMPQAYRAFRLYYFGDGSPEPWTQGRIAQELQIPVTQVYNYVYRARSLLAQEVRAAIAEYTSGEDEIEAEFSRMRAATEGASDLPPPESIFEQGKDRNATPDE